MQPSVVYKLPKATRDVVKKKFGKPSCYFYLENDQDAICMRSEGSSNQLESLQFTLRFLGCTNFYYFSRRLVSFKVAGENSQSDVDVNNSPGLKCGF